MSGSPFVFTASFLQTRLHSLSCLSIRRRFEAFQPLLVRGREADRGVGFKADQISRSLSTRWLNSRIDRIRWSSLCARAVLGRSLAASSKTLSDPGVWASDETPGSHNFGLTAVALNVGCQCRRLTCRAANWGVIGALLRESQQRTSPGQCHYRDTASGASVCNRMRAFSFPTQESPTGSPH